MLTAAQTRRLARHQRYSPTHARRRRWAWKRLETAVFIASAFVAGAVWGGLVVYAHLEHWSHGALMAWGSPLIVLGIVGGSWAWTVEHSTGWEDARGLPLAEAKLALPLPLRQVLQEWEGDAANALLVRDVRALEKAALL